MDAYTDYDDLFADAHAKPDFPVGIFLTDNQDLIEGSPEVKSEENFCPKKLGGRWKNGAGACKSNCLILAKI